MIRQVLSLSLLATALAQYQFKEVPITHTLDHFNFRPHAPGNMTSFSSRYLINDTWWEAGSGPIFFYTGNEGPIDLFAQNTGFMWDLAPEFKALLIFAEHRYYGNSKPFGNDTFKDPKDGKLQWLTSEQALADYADLLHHIKATLPGAASVPVISFGGSYGGMLSAWFRMKYPGTVDGAIAASAPILQFTNVTGPEAYSAITTRTYHEASATCSSGIQKSWGVMESLAASPSGLKQLSDSFHLCKPLAEASSVYTLFNWIGGAIQYMAMADYPQPATFLGPMPAWPVKQACSYFSPDPTDDMLLTSVRELANVFYNWTGQAGSCFNIDFSGPSTLADPGGWDYQSCTEMVMPIGQYGPPSDMFWKAPWNLSADMTGCVETYGIEPRPDWIETTYNGRNLQGVSNIVFSNGHLDPWSGGGVTANITGAPSLVAILIADGAHHLDLRAAAPGDPEDVIVARNIHRMHIRKWISEHNSDN